MKETLDKLKEKYGKNWLEIVLMCAFLCVAVGLNASKIAESSQAVFGRNANGPEGAAGDASQEESEAETESGELSKETGTGEDSEAETEPEGQSAAAGAQGARLGQAKTKAGRETETEAEAVQEEGPAIKRLYDLMDVKVLEACAPVYPPKYYGLVQAQTRGSQEPQWAGQDLLTDTKKIPGAEGLVAYETAGENPARNFTLLRKMLENRIAEYEGDWSVYVKNLDTQESLTVNDRPMNSASIMKLFIMGAVYRAIEAGELERTDEVVQLLDNTIRVSDNDSANRLLYMLGDSDYEAGIRKVNEFIAAYGFSEMTIEYNGFNNDDVLFEEEKFNQVSARDCGKLLEDIYRRSWVSRRVSNEVENMLLGQSTRYKIPAGLPEGVSCGNKSGEMDLTENDAAIVYADNCDYILVVLSGNWTNGNAAISQIRSISELVYEFLN